MQKELPIEKDALNKIIKDANERFNGFSGNCAKFAIVLNKVLKGDDDFIIVDGGHYEFVDHVALEFGDLVIDGDGIVSLEEFITKYEDVEKGIEFDIIRDETNEKEYVRRLVDSANPLCRDFSEQAMEQYLIDEMSSVLIAKPGM